MVSSLHLSELMWVWNAMLPPLKLLIVLKTNHVNGPEPLKNPTDFLLWGKGGGFLIFTVLIPRCFCLEDSTPPPHPHPLSLQTLFTGIRISWTKRDKLTNSFSRRILVAKSGSQRQFTLDNLNKNTLNTSVKHD